MAFTIPAIADIIKRTKADFRTELGVDPLRRSIEQAFVMALAGQAKGLYGYLSYIFKQAFPDTSSDFYFWRWAAIWGITQKTAAPWRGTIEFTGTNTTLIPAGTSVTRSDGQTYLTDVNGTISGGIADIAATASSGGSATNNDASQPLELTSPISGVDSAVTVLSTSQTGTEIETKAEGLIRLLQRIQTPPSGGGPGDYVRWALEVAGVTRAWEFPLLEGANEVSVAFVRDGDGSGSAIVPDSTERAAVLAHLQSVAPITVDVRVITLSAQSVAVTITGLTPDNGTVRAAVEASLADFIAREGAPGGTLNLSRLDAAISAAAGEISHTLTVPSADVTSTTAQIPILGTVTYA